MSVLPDLLELEHSDWRALTFEQAWAKQLDESNAVRHAAHAQIDELFNRNLAEQFAALRAMFAHAANKSLATH